MRTLASVLAVTFVATSISGVAMFILGYPHLYESRLDSTIHRPDAVIVSRRPAMEVLTPTSAARTAASAASTTRDPATARPEPTPTTVPSTPASASEPRVLAAANRIPTDRSTLSTVARIPDTGSSRKESQSSPPATAVAAPETDTSWTWLPITRVRILSISLDQSVVPAPIIQVDGGRTWSVPSFRVGHGQYTAGAGQLGNAVLLGHVASLHDGSVFRNLHRVRTGDIVQIFSGSRRFDYRVVGERIVTPDDISVLEPTGTASLIMITCAGEWVPGIDDYNERLVVRADLVSSRLASVHAR